jgi:hypothetical protein
MAMREAGTLSLLDALDYLELLAEVKPEKLEPAAVRVSPSRRRRRSAAARPREGVEVVTTESQLWMCAGEGDAFEIPAAGS